MMRETGERNLDFDTVVDRTGTKSLKYDFAAKRGMPEDVLPLWVADMDFRTSSYIEDALRDMAAHAIFGYTEADDAYYEAAGKWIEKHYHLETETGWFHKSPGVVFSIACAVRAFTNEGEAVLIQQPVYYPFSAVIRDNGRKVVSNDLVNDGNGYYTIDFDDLEKKIVEEHVRLFLLCSPHNPVGRVWNRDELERIGEICRRHQVVVFCDEIHADFVWEKEFITFLRANPGLKDLTLTATAPTKTFNIASLQVSNMIIPDEGLYAAFSHAYNVSGYSQLGGAGIVAAQAAYEHGEVWYGAVKEYIRANIAHTVIFIKERLPELKVHEPEGTYLVWIDMNGLKLTQDEMDTLIIQKAKLWLDDGAIFGSQGRGFQRINVACPRKTLDEALGRLERAIRT